MQNDATPAINSISTNGWDTVHALRFSEVNKAIVNAKSSSSSFEEHIEDDDGHQVIAGQFAPWQLTTGGDGRNVRLILPIPEAIFEFRDNRDNLRNVKATIEINLDWVQNAAQHDLKNDVQNAPTMISMDFGSNNIPPIRKALFQNLLTKWIQENPQAFDHTFASVDINDAANQGSFAWIKPKNGKISYAVADHDKYTTIENSVFAVLCMTSDDPAPETHMVSASSIPDGVNAALLIRPKAVLKNMFLPNIYLVFDQAKAEDFDLSNDNMSISNNKEVSMGKQDMDGTIVAPKIDKGDYTLTIQDNKIVMHTIAKFDYKLGISISIDHTTNYTIGIDTAGKFILTVLDSKTDASVESSTAFMWINIGAGIGAAILGAASGGIIGAVVEAVTTTTAETATQASIQGVQMVALPAVRAAGAAATNIAPATATQAGTQVAAQVAGTQAPAGLFSTIWASMGAKTFGAIGGTLLGTVVGGVGGAIPNIIGQAGTKDAKDSPTLDIFGKEALSPVTWTNASAGGYTVQRLDLISSLRLSINRSFNN